MAYSEQNVRENNIHDISAYEIQPNSAVFFIISTIDCILQG